MNHPSNWYNMDYSERKEWEKQQSAIEDAEYNARRAKEDAENEIANARKQASRDLQEARNSAYSEYEELNEYCEELKTDKQILIEALHKIFSACGTMTIAQGVNVGEVAQHALIEIKEIGQ